MSPDSPWVRGAVVVFLAVVIQEGALRTLRIQGVRPDVLLAVGIVAAIVATPEAGAVVAFASGLVADVFVNTPFGLTALVASVVAYGAGSIQQGLGASHRWSVPVLTAGATAVAVVVWAALGTVLGLPGLLHQRLLVIAGIVSAFSAVLSVVLAPALRWVFARVPGSVSNAGLASGGRGFLS